MANPDIKEIPAGYQVEHRLLGFGAVAVPTAEVNQAYRAQIDVRLCEIGDEYELIGSKEGGLKLASEEGELLDRRRDGLPIINLGFRAHPLLQSIGRMAIRVGRTIHSLMP